MMGHGCAELSILPLLVQGLFFAFLFYNWELQSNKTMAHIHNLHG